MIMKSKPVGIFDSGIGGISVYRQIRKLLPDESLIYLADQHHVPYGSKNLEFVYDLAYRITEFLLAKECKIIVIACNTACAAALYKLRDVFPEVLFVGMEPAIKPAAQRSKNNVVGVLATEGTLKGVPYADVLRRFARGVQVYEQACSGLAEAIEEERDYAEIKKMLARWINPLREKKVDQLALACTHYPLVLDLIKDVAGTSIEVIDPAEAIARRVKNLLVEQGWLAQKPAQVKFYTTAEQKMRQPNIVRQEFEKVNYCYWGENRCIVEF